jgi:hypothetical protein
MQIIHVLRDQQKLVRLLRQLRDCLMRWIRLRITNPSAAFAVPFPNSFGIAFECYRRRQLCRIEIPPVAVFPAKCRDSAFSGNASAGKNKNACAQDPDCRASVPDANSLSVELKLIWPVIRIFDEASPHWILA